MKRSQIKPYKETECIDCNDGQIRKTVARRCIESPYHYNKHKQAKQREKQKDKPVKSYVIPQVSKRQSVRNREYMKVRNETMKSKMEFLDNDPVCEAKLKGCTYIATQNHHGKGKVGDLLYDKEHFLSVCWNCHDIIERNPNWAKERGFSVDRLT